MPLIRLLLIFAALAVSPHSRAAEGEPEPGLSDYAILTPAVEGRFYVASGADLTMLLNPFFSIASIADRANTKVLRALVERERYDPAPRLADRLAESLGKAGLSAVQEPVARRPAGSLQSLSWIDVPEAPQGKVMIDVTIRWICLCSSRPVSSCTSTIRHTRSGKRRRPARRLRTHPRFRPSPSYRKPAATVRSSQPKRIPRRCGAAWTRPCWARPTAWSST